ncbi:Uncharacterized protein FWK35_00011279 [Aphis craccivora]|uniref:Uncharacterized protein n=1 Tax=Aphis craccivora TaxID=307492 RepID=A0A6G0YSP0_APHCR|nr:Uncharacterized protein FWK35_00011279 [Aphis craccivora]
MNRNFQIRFGDALSAKSNILAGVPQGAHTYSFQFSITFILLIILSLQTHEFLNEIISINSNPVIASFNLQNHLTLRRRLSKSIHTTFTICLSPCPEFKPSITFVKKFAITFSTILNLDCSSFSIKLSLINRYRYAISTTEQLMRNLWSINNSKKSQNVLKI